MSTRIVCPNCRTAHNATDDQRGRRVRCRYCQAIFYAAGPEEQGGVAASLAEPVAGGKQPGKVTQKSRLHKAKATRKISPLVLLLILGGVGGSVLSLLMSEGPSVGASGAIFGLQGAAIVLFRRHRDRILMRDRRIGVVLFGWAVYSIVTGWTSPFIDNGAHIGGVLTGALIARALHPVVLDPMPSERTRTARLWLWLVCVMLVYTLVYWIRSA